MNAMLVGLCVLALAALVLVALPLPSATAEESADATTPVELGAVRWLRSFEAGVAKAQTDGRALLVLFQEVPGWGTCQRYGGQVLAHPLLVDAAQTLFTPLAIYNNTKGDDDAKTRELFEEPAWNNPVVRIVDTDRKDVVKRHAGDYSLAGLLGAMQAAREARSETGPRWFDLFVRESTSRKRGVETAVFGMGWFWTGEAGLALIDGVVATRPGWLAKREVVEVHYDPTIVSYEALVKQAVAKKCAAPVFTRSDAQQKTATKLVGKRAVRNDDDVRTDDDKYYLSRTILKHVPMTPLQAAHVNAWVGEKEDPTPLLSPSQLALLETIRSKPDAAWPEVIGVDFLEAWKRAQAQANLPR